MEKNKELRNAWDFVEHTGISIFLTGKAGTGKTTFLRAVKAHSNKRIVVVAPTGVAAINAGGMTIHSFFQLPLAPFVPESQFQPRFAYSKEKRKIMRTLDLLIIDEISMVRSDVLDAIDSVLRRFRDHNKPFGGVQLLMIGDLQQLTPVVTPNEEAMLQRYYDTPYFFGSKALRSINYVTIELSKVFRQQDETFIGLLNNIREGRPTEADFELLNQCYKPDFKPNGNSDFIRLTTHNRIADYHNLSELNKLSTPEYQFEANIEGQFPEYNYPADYQLTLKRGAQVMFLHNDSEGRFYNGKIGHITYIDNESIQVTCPGEAEAIEVEPQQWENTKYTLNEQTKQIEAEVQGIFTQYPLRLAWAITIHKSQGLTFNHAIIDAQQAFAAGQVYVALSRCRSLEGLVLATPLGASAVKNDERVGSYIAQQQERTQQSIEVLPQLKEEYHRYLVAELFDFTELYTTETSLFRVLIEFGMKFPKVISLHKSTIGDLDRAVLSVSNKWKQIINAMPSAELHSDVVLERIKNGARYFYSQIEELYPRLLDITKTVELTNKVGAKRLDSVFAELEQVYVAKRDLLEEMIDTDFTTAAYLTAKQEAILASIGDTTARKRRKDAKKKAEKPVKEPTAEVSYRMFKSGMSVVDIAKERNLVPTTIYSHLARYVSQGVLRADEVVDEKKLNLIRRIIKGLGEVNNLNDIKQLCPSDVSYCDIRIAIAEKR